MILTGLLLSWVMSQQIFESLEPFRWLESQCHIEQSDVVFVPESDEQCKHRLEYSYQTSGERRIGNTWRLDPGVPYTWCSSWASFASGFTPRSTVDCYIDPADPKQSVLSRGNLFSVLKLLFPLVLISVGVLFLRKKAASSKSVISAARVRIIAQVVAVGVFLAGTIGTFFAGILPLYELYVAQSWESSECKVLSSYLKTSSPSATSVSGGANTRGYQIKIIYSYTWGGQVYVTDRYDFGRLGSGDQKALAKVTDKYPTDGFVQCWVDSNNPYEAVLNRDFSSKYLGGFLPLIASLAGLVLFVSARKFI